MVHYAGPDLFAPALAQAGLAPDRVLYVEAGDDKTVLACVEEGLRHGGLGAVVAKIAALHIAPKEAVPLVLPYADGGDRRRQQISGSRQQQPRAGVFPFCRQSRCPFQVLAVIAGLLNSSAVARVKVLILSWRPVMTRVVSLFLSTWSTDRIRRKSGDAAPPPEAPLVLIGHDGKRRTVLAADAAAQAAGLRVGMPATKAQVLVPGLTVRNAEPEADDEALESLALWILQRYAPIVAADPPDGIVIDTTGADHLHGGEAAMLDSLVARLTASSITARAAVADTQPARLHAIQRGRCLFLRQVHRTRPSPTYQSPLCACRPISLRACVCLALNASSSSRPSLELR